MSSGGQNFARAQLEKYGWSQGKGLGREEGGITEALKPKLKFNSTGLGYDIGEQFKFHWWDHVFNKAADNLSVKKDQDGSVQLEQTESLEVSTKRPSLSNSKSKFYGGFVKGGTLVGEGERAETDTSDEEAERDRSLKLSDEELFKICKGRTAHKGARHGLNMTAKLARVREQELLLLQEWGGTEQGQNDSDKSQSKKKKAKKNKHVDVAAEICVETEQKNAAKPKKKKKSKKDGVSDQSEGRMNTLLVEHEGVQVHEAVNPLKKKKKRDKTKVMSECEPELHTIQKKKKKKKKKYD